MKVSIELGRCFGEVLPPEEMNVEYTIADEYTNPMIHSIVAHKHCPFCGNLENVHFIRPVLMGEVPCWIRVEHECSKCHVWWLVKARIDTEEENNGNG